jgi:hypothetical protein
MFFRRATHQALDVKELSTRTTMKKAKKTKKIALLTMINVRRKSLRTTTGNQTARQQKSSILRLTVSMRIGKTAAHEPH